MKADMHVHTQYSACSKLRILDLIKACRKKSINTVAITDHNTIKGALKAKKTNKYNDLKIVVGCEKKCEYGELLIYGLKKEISSKKFLDIIKEVRKQKARVFIAHPFDFIRLRTKWRNFSADILEKIDGIEVVNGRDVFNGRGKILFKNKNIKGVAGSDSHYAEELGNTYLEYNKDLWKEIDNKTVKFYSKNSILKKLEYLTKSFLYKWFKI